MYLIDRHQDGHGFARTLVAPSACLRLEVARHAPQQEEPLSIWASDRPMKNPHHPSVLEAFSCTDLSYN